MRLPLLTLLLFSSAVAWAETTSAPSADEPSAVHDVASLERAAEPEAAAGNLEREGRRAIANTIRRRLRQNYAAQTAAVPASEPVASAEAPSRLAQSAIPEAAPAEVTRLNATISDLREALADALRNGRRNAISGAVTLRRTQAILALRDSLTPTGDSCQASPADTEAHAVAAQSQAEISALQDDLAKALLDNQRILASAVHLRQRQSRASSTIAALRGDLTRTGDELTKARAMQAETVGAVADTAQLNATIATLRDQLAKAGDELTKARAVHATSAEAATVTDALNATIASLHADLVKSNDDLAQAKAQQQATSVDAAAQASQLTAKIAALESDLADKSEALTQARAVQAPNTDATADIARLNATIADLRHGLSEAQRDTKRAAATAVYQRRKQFDASQLVAALRNDLATANDELANARAAEATNTDAAADIDRLNATVAELRHGLSEAQRNTRRAVAAGVHQRRMQSDTSQLVASLRSDLATTNEELANARAAQQTTSKATAAEATELNATIVSLRDELAKSGSALDQARAAVQAASAGAAADANQHQATLAELESDLARARRESQRAVAGAALQRRRHNEASKLIASLRADLETSQTELVKTRATVQAADANAAANVTRVNAAIAKRDADLAIAQRDSRRAVASLVHERQLRAQSGRNAGKLQEQLAEREDRVDKLTTAVAKLQSDLSDTKNRLQQALADANEPGDPSDREIADVAVPSDASGPAADGGPFVNAAYATESSAAPGYPRKSKADVEKSKPSRVRESVVVDRPLPPRRARWKVLDQYGPGITSLPRRPRP